MYITTSNEKFNEIFHDKSVTTTAPYMRSQGYDSSWSKLHGKYQQSDVNAALEKSFFLYEAIEEMKSASTLNLNNFIAVAKEVSFSEGRISELQKSSSESQQSSFSEPYGLVGNYTTAPMELLIQDIGTMPTVTPLLTSMFPNIPVSAQQVFIDKMQGFSGIAGEVNEDGLIPVANRLNSYALQYSAGLWGVRIDIPVQDLLYKRMMGGSSLAQRGYLQEIAYNTINAVQKCNVRQHKLISDMIFNNGFTYRGADIVSNIPSDNIINLSAPIGSLDQTTGDVTYNTTSGFNPFSALAAALGAPILQKYRSCIKGMLINALDYQYMLSHPNSLALNGSLAMGSALLDRSINISINNITKEVMAFFGTGQPIPLIPDNSLWVQDDVYGNTATTPNLAYGTLSGQTGAQQYFVPRGKILLLMDYSILGYSGPAGAFHMTLSPLDMNYAEPAQGLFTAVVNRNLSNSDYMNKVSIFAGLSGGPALYRPNDIFMIGGLYSNVS